MLDKEEEKKTLMKKMMVRKQLAGLWHQGGGGQKSQVHPLMRRGWGGVEGVFASLPVCSWFDPPTQLWAAQARNVVGTDWNTINLGKSW